MKNLYSYIVSIPLILLALVPAIAFKIDMPTEGIWFWYILVAGFLGCYTLFLKVNPFLKILVVGSFINCFFSSAPYLSFTAYISLVFCCYFYILCLKVKDWTVIFNVVKTLLILNVFILIMQIFGKDTLLQFGQNGLNNRGIVGNTMQMGSLSVVLSSILILVNPLFIAFPIIVSKFYHSAGAWLSGFVGAFIYLFMKYIKNNKKEVVITIGIIVLTIFLVFAFRSGEIQNLKTGSRLHVWVKSIQLTNEHPIMGYGIGTFKHLFHPLSGMKTVAFRTAHNFFVQILFETGYSGLLFILSMLSYLFYKLIKTKSILCLVGLSMLVADGLVHFPDRMIQAILLIVMFLAYCTVKIKERSDGRTE